MKKSTDFIPHVNRLGVVESARKALSREEEEEEEKKQEEEKEEEEGTPAAKHAAPPGKHTCRQSAAPPGKATSEEMQFERLSATKGKTNNAGETENKHAAELMLDKHVAGFFSPTLTGVEEFKDKLDCVTSGIVVVVRGVTQTEMMMMVREGGVKSCSQLAPLYPRATFAAAGGVCVQYLTDSHMPSPPAAPSTPQSQWAPCLPFEL
ncbi:hypothetical protein JOB18_014038 [Solea senegalensis]|uniref:Uncharacterized protein n=1 Tax=Solea senegalensis TaxID=28829 RepID=A0AAV6PQF5_SOLSE|nr:hypothetical protein JOB18_014038 [Solea senegalensis]